MAFLHTIDIQKELIARGLLPEGCRLVEVSISPDSALVIRYEVYITGDGLDRFADAMKAAAVKALEDDERHRLALARKDSA